MSTVNEIWDGFAATLAPIGDEIEKLQIVADMVVEPTPPCIDVYPGDPFTVPNTMGPVNMQLWRVRARVSTAAQREGGRRLLGRLLDTEDAASVESALYADETLDGTVGNIAVRQASGLQSYIDPSGQGFLLGCAWDVEVYP